MISRYGWRPVFAATAVAVGLSMVLPAVSGAATSPAPVARGTDAATRAAAAADRAADSGFDALAKGPEETLVRRDVVAGSGGYHYVSYERRYRGLPVIGGDAVVAIDDKGAVRGTATAGGHGIRLAATKPKLSGTSAATIARGRLDRVDDASPARLVVFAGGPVPLLAYEVLVEGVRSGAPSRLHVIVDATRGTVLDTRDDVRHGTGNGFYNGSVTIGTSGAGGSFSMQDGTRPGIRCGGQNGATFTGTDDNWGNGSGTNLETACVDALYAVQREWDMLGAWLGRNGINGSGSGFPARVGLNEVNAFWNGSYTNFGHSQDNQRQATPIDVVAHEFGHAIFQTTPGGAGSGNENGGLNESTGDIFGALTESFANNPNDPPDFLVGEEVNLVGGGPIRNMYNPSALGDPNCYSSAIPNTEVHAAAGPNNHWFYLTAIGSAGGGGNPSSPTCNGSSVAGIGLQKAGQIYMAALNMKTSSWRYVNVRTATLRAAVNLFGASSPECRTVKAAWDAVSVPAQAGEAQCTVTPGNDFSITLSPASATVAAGGSTTATVATSTTSGSAQTVNLSVTGAPSGVTATVSPTSVTSGAGATLSVSVAATAAAGTSSLTVTGTGTGATHTATFTLTVTGGGGGGCGGVPAWASATAYVPDDVVSHNGHRWKATWWSTGAEPGAPASWAVWSDQGAC